MLPFGKNSTPPNKPNRNHFDHSHQNNLTMDYGILYPFMCTPVLPGDSSKIDVAFGIRALPTAFPVQTKIRVDAHFFYVRNRNLWEDWPNFIGNTGDTSKYQLPYLNSGYLSQALKTGSLGDYLGLPTTLVSERNTDYVIPGPYQYNSTITFGGNYKVTDLLPVPDGDETIVSLTSSPGTGPKDVLYFSGRGYGSNILPVGSDVTIPIELGQNGIAIDAALKRVLSDGNFLYAYPLRDNNKLIPLLGPGEVRYNGSTPTIYYKNLPYEVPINLISGFMIYVLNDDKSGVEENQFTGLTNQDFSSETYINTYNVSYHGVNPVPSTMVSKLPKISALPFRAYESIYNSFYRDQRNNPYIVNGVADPNVYIPTKKGGNDPNYYGLHRRNWEQDFLTTAVPSPQQGAAPLVGITSSGTASFAMDDGTKYDVKLTTAEDGDTITGAEYSSNLPNSVARSLVNIATSGISISDFRNVNAYQRWLEINMRRGLKYKDQILSHFGVDVDYAALDMPEFLGGFTKWFDSSQINQTAESDGSPLGSYAGQLSAIGGTEHTINRYFDEHGYIIGIVSIVPVPVYSQLMPKDFYKRSPLDYYFPEFGHISFQPIPFREVAPFQAMQDGIDINSTYGYQRPWYEYLAATDEVHGDFRTTLRDFLLARQFTDTPTLDKSFLLVDSKQINNVFTASEYIDDNGDSTRISPFLGQIHIKHVMKRPIPLYGIPRLE